VIAHFEDGTTAVSDVLVAADGGGSRVRRQFLPHAERIDTGVIGIAGKVFLDGGNRNRIAPELLDGMALVSAKGGYSLFVALQDIDHVNDGDATDAMGDGSSHFDNSRSYLMWALGARRHKLGLDGGAEALQGEPLRAIALDAMAAWDDRFKALVRLADPGTINAIAMRSARPVAPWPTRRITLIGDAIHSMTPYRGIGANMALEDAVRLKRAIVAGAHGERDLFGAIGDYETQMRDYGFRAARNSLKAMRQSVDAGAFSLTMQRLMLRTMDRLPPMKRWMAARMGRD